MAPTTHPDPSHTDLQRPAHLSQAKVQQAAEVSRGSGLRWEPFFLGVVSSEGSRAGARDIVIEQNEMCLRNCMA
jgi:hypothetical protein